ncbi:MULTISPECIES: DMT family transporter [unclassified Bacillus (in: firmicutes)]|uniref:DMT family transporter n=1 Tax=unclassified Bacillus (in: firmicutes) TaxID=185979 RepID=UPI0008E84252|nr:MULTISPECIES: DMT family transporter [unclassified Bacillus (in: firmicutes)]SFA99387.1 EamA-like transporter family protein [Bacillus sp. UNCCL13]SFQ81603.1 EamA-like transporter family protein [Bacillus sp. cl95]
MNKTILADFSLLIVAFIWGITFVLVQDAIQFLEPFSFNGIRFAIAALFLIVWLWLFERNQIAMCNKKILISGIFLGFWLFLGYAFQTIGLLFTTSSKAGFITGLSVVLVPLFAFLIWKILLSTNAIIGVLIATFGLFLLTMGDISAINIGDIFVFMCAIAFALHILLTGKFSGQFPTLLLTIIQISTVAILSIICSYLFEDWQQAIQIKVLFTEEVLTALIITSLFATAFAFFAQTNFQKYTSATRVALIFAMEPVFAAVAGYFWAGERLSNLAFLGCFLIFFGMLLAEVPSELTTLLRKRIKNFNR